MKNAIIFLLLFVNVGMLKAQYLIKQTKFVVPYEYQIKIKNDSLWTQGDLITWIFPDGQFMQKSIQLDSLLGLNHTDMVDWTPCASGPSGTPPSPKGIQAFIAKKGGTGNPPQIMAPNNQNFPFNSLYDTTAQPVQFNFPTLHKWQINKSWELFPDEETFIIFTYKPNSTEECASNLINLSFDTTKLTLGDFYGFNDDTPPPATVYASNAIINIEKFARGYISRHIFFKVKPTASVAIGDTIEIIADGIYCGDRRKETLLCVVEAFPHDPNKKTVDIDTIYSNQTDAVKLTYTVQFQNDGNNYVDSVDIIDHLPEGLNPSTFQLVDTPKMNGLVLGPWKASGPDIKLTFRGKPGLPGLGQTKPASYSYDRTIYRYKYSVETDPNYHKPIENVAKVTFYHKGIPLPHLITNTAQVFYVDKDCSCWQRFWWRFFNIFRRVKRSPC